MLEGGPLMLVVFLLLGIIIVIYVNSKNVRANRAAITELQTKSSSAKQNTSANTKKTTESSSEEEIAAFLALHLYMTQNMHDKESNVLTIERIQRRYSPWNSKIYSMNNFQ